MTETLLLLSGRTATADPVEADGDVSALSITPAGRLRVDNLPGGPVLGKVAAADPAAVADGVTQAISLTASGRLRTDSKDSTFPLPLVVAPLAAINDSAAADVSISGRVVVHAKNASAAANTAGAFVFEASLNSTNGTDGDWFVVQGVRTNANTVESAPTNLGLAVNAATPYAWEISTGTAKWFRVRCTTAVNAGASITFSIMRGRDAAEPIPGIQTHPVTVNGTVTTAGTATTTPTQGSFYGLITTASTNAASVKGTAGAFMELSVFNGSAATVYLKLYNKATAPTVGTDLPMITIPIAAGAYWGGEFGPLGKRFSNGIALAMTAAAVYTDATAVAAGVQINGTFV